MAHQVLDCDLPDRWNLLDNHLTGGIEHGDLHVAKRR